MVLNNNDDLNQSGSIFNSNELREDYPQQPDYAVQPQVSSKIIDIFNRFVDKFIDEPKKQRELRNFQKRAEDILSEHEEVLKIFYNYGCNIIIRDNFLTVEYPPLNLSGNIIFTDNGVEFDANTNKIMEQLAKLVMATNAFGSQMDDFEKQEFYPVGELEQVSIKYNNEEITALCGTLMNKQGETKKIYYYKGKEITPDGE